MILLNKIDLVPPDELDKLEARIKSMNAAARIYRTKNATVDMDQILTSAASISTAPWRSIRASWSRSIPSSGAASTT